MFVSVGNDVYGKGLVGGVDYCEVGVVYCNGFFFDGWKVVFVFKCKFLVFLLIFYSGINVGGVDVILDNVFVELVVELYVLFGIYFCVDSLCGKIGFIECFLDGCDGVCFIC